jgi:hypothetical protein
VKVSYRRDGRVTIFGGIDDTDELVAEAEVISFNPVRSNSRCVCGAKLGPWSLHHTVYGVELGCHRCHCVHARLELGVRVRR